MKLIFKILFFLQSLLSIVFISSYSLAVTKQLECVSDNYLSQFNSAINLIDNKAKSVNASANYSLETYTSKINFHYTGSNGNIGNSYLSEEFGLYIFNSTISSAISILGDSDGKFQIYSIIDPYGVDQTKKLLTIEPNSIFSVLLNDMIFYDNNENKFISLVPGMWRIRVAMKRSRDTDGSNCLSFQMVGNEKIGHKFEAASNGAVNVLTREKLKKPESGSLVLNIYLPDSDEQTYYSLSNPVFQTPSEYISFSANDSFNIFYSQFFQIFVYKFKEIYKQANITLNFSTGIRSGVKRSFPGEIDTSSKITGETIFKTTSSFLMSSLDSDEGINIFFSSDFIDSLGYAGFASALGAAIAPGYTNKYVGVIVSRTRPTVDALVSTTAHEVGHILGLFHPSNRGNNSKYSLKSSNNLMSFRADISTGTKLSPVQIEIMLSSPYVTHP